MLDEMHDMDGEEGHADDWGDAFYYALRNAMEQEQRHHSMVIRDH